MGGIDALDEFFPLVELEPAAAGNILGSDKKADLLRLHLDADAQAVADLRLFQ